MVKALPPLTLALLAFSTLTPASPTLAQNWPAFADAPGLSASRAVRRETWVEEWDPYARRWVRAGEPSARIAEVTFRKPPAPVVRERFGPFVVLDDHTAALMGTTNAESPADFRRMRAAFPDIAVLELIDAPGTVQDVANLEVGRMIRAAGIATHVPANGSVRSGAVELFLAGTTRSMDPGARFAVHSWRDQRGRGPQDFAPDDPVNRLYTAYYEDMGMSPSDARAFYDMTNSVPHASALWFGPEVMNGWVAKQDRQAIEAAVTVRIAFDPDFISQAFAPLDDFPLLPTIRFGRTLPERFAALEAKAAFAGT